MRPYVKRFSKVVAIFTVFIELEDGWQELRRACNEKSSSLRDAYAGYQFQKRVDELDRWIDAVESQLVNEDHGKDMASANALQKRHEQLRQDIFSRKPQFEEIEQRAAELSTAGHLMAAELTNRTRCLLERYQGLQVVAYMYNNVCKKYTIYIIFAKNNK